MPVSHKVSGGGCNSSETSWGTLKYGKLTDRASNPGKATKGSVGFDICSSQTETILSKERHLIPTDPVLIPPPRTYIRLAPKSGLAWKFGINVLVVVNDPKFREDVKVLLQKHGEEALQIQARDQIAQGILERVMLPIPREEAEKDVTKKGALGFGEADA
ncbi:deoxyuridine 5'-triphosphate nucleotidohydrolase, mitochondrial-like [Ambystoma mexicanum]|uniref:deoxyuridine 5'-triphosphate nucleotidohydrolase, mitochondrial-like n=1 Tax=Ambystoma mexicanum TaxID=8296 RepID=UPI0037E8348B